MKDWFENESFWIETYPFLFPNKSFLDAIEQVDKLLKLIDFRGSSILDLCCGPGRHSIELARRGFSVTGVDKSPFLIEKAKERAKAESVNITWTVDDMRNYSQPNNFDLALNMFGSFGYFSNKMEDIRVLENLFTNLRSGGKCLIDVMGKEKLAALFQPTVSQELEDGSLIVQRNEIIDNWTRVKNKWTLIKNNKATTFEFRITIYSGQELIDRLDAVGFQEIKLYGDLEGIVYGPNAQRLIITGNKP